MLHLNPAEQEEANFQVATDADWDREEARELGQLHPEKPWILTDRDAWHKNPNYTGPAVPHPEDECWEREGEAPSCDCPETPACHQELCDECRAAFEQDMLNRERVENPVDPPF
tara:strand:- start:680 stop:1021 length:342 start_codon:yes stop_codon:yes gene_type:complete